VVAAQRHRSVRDRLRGEALADLLDLDLAGDRAEGRVTSVGVEEPVPGVAARLLPSAPTRWRRHDRLQVDNRDVGWWVDDEGAVHATSLDRLAPALAWAGDRWPARFALAAVLREPSAVGAVEVDAAFD
jgi:hypothetical protein